MSVAIVHNGDELLPRIVPRGVELIVRRNTDDLWSFQWTTNRICILSADDQTLCAWLVSKSNLSEVAARIAEHRLCLLKVDCAAFGIAFDREIFRNRKIYRSDAGLILDMCHTADMPLKFMHVDKPGLPVITSTINYYNPPLGYRMGPNA